jgi:aspartokinase/homoserine dehydrogenase 1
MTLLNQTLVMKFGGTSVGTPEAMANAAAIIQSAHKNWPRLVVVTSALSGVTNLLLDTALASALEGAFKVPQAARELRTLHYTIIQALIPDIKKQEQLKQEILLLITEFANLCNAIAVIGEASPRALDAVAALGERMCVRLLTAVVTSQGIPARWIETTRVIVTDDNYISAHPDMEKTRAQVQNVLTPILDSGEVAVITGFIGATVKGVTTTLGRGGSDYSAAIMGAALPAKEVWIWTDVDGVMTADPRLVPEARTIPALSYREVGELAYFGAKVLHPKTIRPVIDAGIGLRVCNTFNPSHPGTRLVAERDINTRRVIQAVTGIRGLCLVTLEGRGMLGVPGVAARTFSAVAATGTSVPLITQASSEQSICFAIPVESNEQVIMALEKAFAAEISSQDIDRVWASDEVVIITIVGQGMRNTPGISGKIFSALGDAHINVIAIAQGSSEVSISTVISAADIQPALKALHALIN